MVIIKHKIAMTQIKWSRITILQKHNGLQLSKSSQLKQHLSFAPDAVHRCKWLCFDILIQLQTLAFRLLMTHAIVICIVFYLLIRE